MVGWGSSSGWSWLAMIKCEGSSSTYVKEELALHAVLGLLFQKDVTNRVHNEHLAVLSDNALLSSLRSGSNCGLNGSADASRACGSHSLDLLALLVFLVHGALLPTVPGHKLFIRGFLVFFLVIPLFGVDWVDSRNALNGSLVTPGGLARVADVALDKLPAAPPAHEEGKVMHASAHDQEHTHENGAEPGTETLVVVAAASPRWEAISQEVVVSLTLRALEHVRNDGQPLIASSDLLEVCVDFLLGGALAHFHARCLALLLVVLLVLVDELLAGLVGMKLRRLLAVGLVQLVLRRAGLDSEELVEGDIVALGGGNLVADTEDLMVCLDVSKAAALAQCVCGGSAWPSGVLRSASTSGPQLGGTYPL
jgi:hypothetical protein